MKLSDLVFASLLTAQIYSAINENEVLDDDNLKESMDAYGCFPGAGGWHWKSPLEQLQHQLRNRRNWYSINHHFHIIQLRHLLCLQLDSGLYLLNTFVQGIVATFHNLVTSSVPSLSCSLGFRILCSKNVCAYRFLPLKMIICCVPLLRTKIQVQNRKCTFHN